MLKLFYTVGGTSWHLYDCESKNCWSCSYAVGLHRSVCSLQTVLLPLAARVITKGKHGNCATQATLYLRDVHVEKRREQSEAPWHSVCVLRKDSKRSGEHNDKAFPKQIPLYLVPLTAREDIVHKKRSLPNTSLVQLLTQYNHIIMRIFDWKIN